MIFIRKKKILRMVEGTKNYHHEIFKMYKRQAEDIYSSDKEMSEKLLEKAKQHYESFLEWSRFYEKLLND